MKLMKSLEEIIRLGTTKKGIGPAYEDKVGRRAIRLCDLKFPKLLKLKIKNLYDFHKPRLISLKIDIIKNYNDLIEISMNKFLNSFTVPLWKIINDAGKQNKFILFEGAQGFIIRYRLWYLSICNIFKYNLQVKFFQALVLV